MLKVGGGIDTGFPRSKAAVTINFRLLAARPLFKGSHNYQGAHTHDEFLHHHNTVQVLCHVCEQHDR